MSHQNQPPPPGETDTVLVAGVMRTGQTWLCFMLAHAWNARFVEPYCLLRGILYSGNAYVRSLTQGNLPGRSPTSCRLVVKTHEPPDRHFSLTRNVVLIVRDPRDTITSAVLRYHVMKTTGSDIEEDAQSLSLLAAPVIRPSTIKDRVWQIVYGSRLLSVILTARKWSSFNRAWMQVPFVHVVRYEDLIADPARQLSIISEKTSIDTTEQQLGETSRQLSMAEINQRHVQSDQTKRIGFRKGVAGDYKNHLTRLEIAIVRHYCRTTAHHFGYDL